MTVPYVVIEDASDSCNLTGLTLRPLMVWGLLM